MDDERKARLAGTLLGVVLFEVALATATAGAAVALSAAGKAGKLATIKRKLEKVASPALVRKLMKALDSVLDKLHNPKRHQPQPAKTNGDSPSASGDVPTVDAANNGATIASGLTGRPSAILHGYGNLSRTQQGLLDNLAEFGSQTLVRKASVSMNDLAALTAKTGDEFLMLTLGGRRMIVRGSSQGFHGLVTEEWAKQMAAQGWRLSGHTHPILRGQSSLSSLMSSGGDRQILEIFGQQRSVIHNTLGDWSVFTPLGD